MPLINRNDLRYDYIWSSNPKNSPSVTGRDRRSFFRPDQGDEVLSLINEYGSDRKIQDREKLLEIETLLRNKLGQEERSREDVKVWLDDLMGDHSS